MNQEEALVAHSGITLKDPHRNAERALMDQGKKLAYLLPQQAHNLPLFGPEFVIEPHEYNGTTRWLVYRPEDAEGAKLFLRTYQLCDEGKIRTEMAHKTIGMLLGYTDEQIDWFVTRRGSDPLI